MSTGVCRNAACAKSLTAEPIERYPGPGQFCPDCGELLQSVPGGRSGQSTNGAAAAKQSAVARGAAAPNPPGESPAKPDPATDPARATATTATEPEVQGPVAPGSTLGKPVDDPVPGSFAQFRNDLQSALAGRVPVAAPPDGAAPSPRKPPWYALLAIVAAVGLALVVLRPVMTMSSKSTALRVCGSSVTTRIASDILAAYEAKGGAQTANASVVSSGPCDVQFAAARHAGSGAQIARDGVVLVVHPQNPIRRVTVEQLRRIVSGEITDWSQLGGERGTIFIVLPAESTDERRALAGTTLRGTRVASRVLHVASSADIVRLVAGPNGRRWLGVVAFSAAVPAKVVPLGAAPIPSAASIADDRYPLTLDVTVHGDARNAAAGSLIAFARSREVEAIVSRDGFIAKGNN